MSSATDSLLDIAVVGAVIGASAFVLKKSSDMFTKSKDKALQFL